MTALLEARGVTKRFGAVEALRGASFAVGEGEVVALMGDNGAGKSTLIKTICGVYAPDAGEIRFAGSSIAGLSPSAVHGLGIETVYQDLALAPDLDTAANLFLGRELLAAGLLGRFGVLAKKRMAARAVQVLTDLKVAIKDPTAPVATLSGGQQQSVAVARAVTWADRLVIMDEPTAALGVPQTRAVLDLIRRVRDSGRSVVLISHSLPDVMAVSDRIEVLRLGRRVARLVTRETDEAQIVGAMTGAWTQEDAE
ncbi:ATP-binding cassette domain-containing protein [Phytohabitans sp. ZYX-F-186]|uniref:ATP-binding cassette domain-containing protein n=1 Tax=Phytohabitans maris TaxID=3071409 RepID=A0ABU0ZIV9_9ACTN|nr:ATP-binding cassette domain-containing protein [Phytohabitans sp. ZYX-F-186]MDQ7906339.1 ATP-binding cassette domain-containing protein [Phytohabitans sp. ZYX-F-186]